jgi:hypothetical protein
MTPKDDYHHMMATNHGGKIWTLGGHNGVRFFAADTVHVFSPVSKTDPIGFWTAMKENGNPCDAAPAASSCQNHGQRVLRSH